MTQLSYHHLTPEGWVESDTRPIDAVETWKRTPGRSALGKLTVDYERTFVDPAWSAYDLAALRERYQRPEESVGGDIADISWEVVD